ncbi:hypothetical protein PV08_02192 [Exophiala spinifera]|uniref:AB hydrolase-1 domain-containing protein n=1 Tax=Exophiala spinifera TaxID=91928 RepID=A0A0D2AA33_9EURO|nr:uncharacterized protein PV08_02192 [Exophiala spinifera]KIW21612.1 hypothetical protein PV08_02192 [Exophiala spinifera]
MTTSEVTLPDGRILAYIDYDPPTASGDGGHATAASPAKPVLFYCHGFPGSRVEGDFLKSTAQRHGARLISIDRPGMGLSTFQPHRTVLDWPQDVLHLANHLHIDGFYVVGASGGAPYVFACVKALPKTRLLGACVVAGAYPLSLGTDGMSWPNRILMWTASSKWFSWVSSLLMDLEFGSVARDREHPERMTKMMVQVMKSRPGPDAKCVDSEWATAKLVEALQESYRQPGDGVNLDIKLIAGDWGFNLADLDTEGFNISLWHGGLDANVPVGMARKGAALIKGAKLRVLEDEAHLSISMNAQDQFLETLLGR